MRNSAGGSVTFSSASIRSPNTVPWAQPEVCTLLLELLLVVGLALGAHDDDGQFLVVIDAGDGVVGLEHVLVEQIAEREIFGMVADGHRRHDLLRIEEDRQRALDRHRGLDRGAGLVDAVDALGQPRIERIGADEIVVVGRIHAANVGEAAAAAKARQARGPACAGPPHTHTYASSPGNISRARPPSTQINRIIGNGMPMSHSNNPRPMTSSCVASFRLAK